MPAAGYSGTPLARKLGIKAGDRVVAIGAPKHYRELLAPLPDGVTFGRTPSATTRIVHLFTTERAELAAADRMAGGAAHRRHVWVSAEESLKVPTDITEDVRGGAAHGLGGRESVCRGRGVVGAQARGAGRAALSDGVR